MSIPDLKQCTIHCAQYAESLSLRTRSRVLVVCRCRKSQALVVWAYKTEKIGVCKH